MSREAIRNLILGVLTSLIAAVVFALLFDPFKRFINRSYLLEFKFWQAGVTLALLLIVFAVLNLTAYRRHLAFRMFEIPTKTKFYRRMFVSSHAKKIIAKYCVLSDFWQKNDVVFIESGTLPVSMVSQLYRRRNRQIWPKLVITNNLACSTIAMSAREASSVSAIETSDVYPDDTPLNCIHIGGQVLDDYAATIPEDLIGQGSGRFWNTDQIVDYLRIKGVNHVVMMCSRLSREDGPCAMSEPMRMFKKLLLKYVAENPEVRLSVLGEAEKFSEREGKSADDILLPNVGDSRYWERVLRNGRTTIIAAVSPRMTRDKIGRVKHVLRELQSARATCILLDIDGRPMHLA